MRRVFTALILGLGLCLAACHKKPDPSLLYVSAEVSGEVVVIDPQSASVVARIPVGKRPRGLKVSHDGRMLYVALSGSPRPNPNTDDGNPPPADRAADGIGVVDLVERRLVKTLPSGQDPECFDLSLDGKTLFVSNEESATLTVLDLESGQIKRKVPVGKEPEGVTLRPDGKVIYATSKQGSNVIAIDTTSFERVADIAAGMRPRAIVFSKDGSVGFVSNELGGTLSAFDAHANKPLGTVTVEANSPSGERPMGLALSPSGAELFVSTGRGGAVAVIDVAKRQFARLIRGVGTRPWGIAVASDGKHVFTANGPSDDVSIIDLASGKVEKRVATGGSPWGAATGAY
ncbi:MAG TPA: beta-propeller fold lactonase family protein [Polyangiaceae bacterium]|jgi:YVTN family beta-propeller protein|nr:beta-propeller fold lactonase family protein [Polyangiaceae bacterium]